MYHDHDPFIFKIDLAAFEQVIADDKALTHFHARSGPALLRLMDQYEARLNGLNRFEPFPPLDKIRALQFSFFDNGPVPERSNGSKEPLRQKTRFGGNIKVWTRTSKIDFSKAGQVAWVANVYFWNETDARFHIDKLRREKCISHESVDVMEAVIANAKGEEYNPDGKPVMFAIPLRSIHKKGSKWMDRTIVALTLDGDKPDKLALFDPDNNGFEASYFSDRDPRGVEWREITKRLAEQNKRSAVTYQARVGFTADLGPWSTQII